MAARAVVFGYGDLGLRGLAVLLELGLEVPLVVTHLDDPHEARWYGSLAHDAAGRGLAVALAAPPALPACDLVFSFYYREMLPMPLLAPARRGAYNLHGSLLPKYRGRAPLNWAILKGERQTGVTLHEMVAKPDAGRIVDQEAVPIEPDETAVEVFRKFLPAAERVLRRSVPRLLAGSAELRAQDLRQGSYFGRRRPEDGRIDWSRPAQEIHDLVRAVAPPFPGAFCDFQGRTLRVDRTRMDPQRRPPAGVLGPYREGDEWFAACGDGRVLRLLQLGPT